MSRYWRFGDPQALIFTMIMMIILRFGLLLVVFDDDFRFSYWKECYFYSYICLGDLLLKTSRPPWGSRPQVGKPWSICLIQFKDWVIHVLLLMDWFKSFNVTSHNKRYFMSIFEISVLNKIVYETFLSPPLTIYFARYLKIRLRNIKYMLLWCVTNGQIRTGCILIKTVANANGNPITW